MGVIGYDDNGRYSVVEARNKARKRLKAASSKNRSGKERFPLNGATKILSLLNEMINCSEKMF